MLEFAAVLVLLGIVAWFVTAPLRAQRTGQREQRSDVHHGAEMEGIEAAKEAKYREIREAELDYRTGKLSKEDYDRIDTTLRAEAVELLKEEDELES